MEIHFNPRDNGACPLCTKIATCAIRTALAGSLEDLRDSSAQGMEIVVYSCPMFKERF
jgi:hypothetical protein